MTAVTNVIEAALFEFLTTHATVGALISTRCYPEVAPQDNTRAVSDHIVFHNVSTTPVQSHGGQSGLNDSRYQFDCASSTHAAAKALALAVCAAFDDDTAVGTWASIPVRACTVEDINYIGFDLDTRQHSFAVDVMIAYE